MRLMGLFRFIFRARGIYPVIELHFYLKGLRMFFFFAPRPPAACGVLSLIYSYPLNFVCHIIRKPCVKFIFPLVISPSKC